MHYKMCEVSVYDVGQRLETSVSFALQCCPFLENTSVNHFAPDDVYSRAKVQTNLQVAFVAANDSTR